jgi:hypothetical protein
MNRKNTFPYLRLAAWICRAQPAAPLELAIQNFTDPQAVPNEPALPADEAPNGQTVYDNGRIKPVAANRFVDAARESQG